MRSVGQVCPSEVLRVAAIAVLQCVAVCVAVGVLLGIVWSVEVCCSVLQCVAVC